MIRVELTDQQARAIANAVALLRDGLADALGLSPDDIPNLADGHARLIAALERQEEHAP